MAAGLILALSGFQVGSGSTKLFGAEYVWTYRARRSEVPAECSHIIKKRNCGLSLMGSAEPSLGAACAEGVQGSNRAMRALGWELHPTEHHRGGQAGRGRCWRHVGVPSSISSDGGFLEKVS